MGWRRIIGDVFNVLEATAAAKKSDGGMSLLLGPEAATFISGMTVADGAKLEKVLKELVEKLQKEQPQVKVKTEAYEKVRLDVFSLPLAGTAPR